MAPLGLSKVPDAVGSQIIMPRRPPVEVSGRLPGLGRLLFAFAAEERRHEQRAAEDK
jgi:hypothetical protein